MCACHCACVPQHIYEGQRTIFWSQVSLSTFVYMGLGDRSQVTKFVPFLTGSFCWPYIIYLNNEANTENKSEMKAVTGLSMRRKGQGPAHFHCGLNEVLEF